MSIPVDALNKSPLNETEEDLTQGGKYSNGTGALAIQLSSIVQSFGAGFFIDTILINLGTLLRNRIEKIGDNYEQGTSAYEKMITTSANTMVEGVAKELQEFIRTIVQAYSNTKIEKPYLLFYCPAYERILPLAMLRSINGQRKMLQQAVDRMIQEIQKSGLNRDVVVDQLTIRYLPMIEKTSVPRTLVNVARSLKNRQQVIMVSHQAIDWHICDVIRNMVLLESHTGKVKKPDQFGEKAFGVDLPFLPSTHAALGDKTLIQPAVSGKIKDELLALAESQKWSIRTSEYISSSIRSKGWITLTAESFFRTR